jgi:hypothetical protein
VARGFSPAVLDQMDVGYSRKLDRHVVPLFDDAGRTCIGYTARSPYNPCLLPNCEVYHPPGSPCPGGRAKWEKGYAKWYNNPGLQKESMLYGYSQARTSDSRFVILVEGPSEVWRAAEAGYLAVAVLGNTLSRAQANKLATLKKCVFLLFDNDDAGRDGGRHAYEQLRKQGVTADTLPLPKRYKDLGEMPTLKVAEWLQGELPPLLERRLAFASFTQPAEQMRAELTRLTANASNTFNYVGNKVKTTSS